ncbi:MAG TPA: magnesium/cobalt transporter CorA [Planctomycetota bacterium]|jgi:magnesium transporter|nr:magnesium/cobalt transporter CorA [Planctomycetota bacterium]
MLKAIYARPGQRPVESASEAEIAAFYQERQGCLWVDLESPSDAERGILERVFAFHRLAIENCLLQSNHPRIDDYGDYFYLVVHGVTTTGAGTLQGEPRIRLQEIDAFLGEHVLVTYHASANAAIDGIRKKCAEVDRLMGRGPDRVLAEILDHVAEEYMGVMEGLDSEIDTLEDRLFRHASKPALREIFSLKKDVLHLRRVVTPQREVLNRLARAEHKAVSKEETIYFRDVYDHIYRVAEMLESFRDVLSSSLEVYLTVVANRTNEVMKVLTVFSIILMTASFLAGLYGMNVHLPGQESKASFYILLVVMASFSGALLYFFRKRRWI